MVILAFDSFKGCINSSQACSAAAQGLASLGIDCLCVPLSDGGEGFAACIAAVLHLKERSVLTVDALQRPLCASYYVSEDGLTAYMDVASSAGLALLDPTELDPVNANSRGVGIMMSHAILSGCRKIVVGLGGSACTDAGRGLLEALPERIPDNLEVIAASDVQAPLYGPTGAAYVFAPQKGASPEQVELLDSRLREYGKGESVYVPGAGAAGGIGYALLDRLSARIVSGIDLFLDIVGFEELLRGGVEIVLTGEGRSDAQTLMGKAPAGVLRRCRERRIPVHLLSGQIVDAEKLLAAGFASVSDINEMSSMSLVECLLPANALQNLQKSVERLLQI